MGTSETNKYGEAQYNKGDHRLQQQFTLEVEVRQCRRSIDRARDGQLIPGFVRSRSKKRRGPPHSTALPLRLVVRFIEIRHSIKHI